MKDRTRVKGKFYSSQNFALAHPMATGGRGIIKNPIYERPYGFSLITDQTEHEYWQPCSHLHVNMVPKSIGTIPALGEYVACSDPLYGHDYSSLPENVPDLPSSYISTESFCNQHYTRIPLSVGKAISLSQQMSMLAHSPEYVAWFNDLYENFTDQMPDKTSLANFLIELKGGLKEVLPTVHDLKSRISSNFLKWKFGIMPDISDIKEILSVWSDFRKRMSFLEKLPRYVDRKRFHSTSSLLGKQVLDHYELEYRPPSDPPSPGHPPIVKPAVHHPIDIIYQEEWADVEFNCHAVINNQLSGLNHIWNQVDAIASMLGLTNITKIYWNAVSWTWLYDWFIDTDQILQRMEAQPFEGKLVIERAYMTMKVRSSGQVFCCTHGNETNRGNTTDLLIRLFERTDRLKIDDSSICPSLIAPSLTGSQEAVLLALLDQRCRKVPYVKRLKQIKGKVKKVLH